MSTLREIGKRLSDEGVGSITGLQDDRIFLGRMKGKPKKCFGVFPTAGLEPIETMGSPFTVMMPSVQVMARAEKPEDCEQMIADVVAALHGVADVTLVGGTKQARYLRIQALQSEGESIGLDDAALERYTINFQIWKERSVSV